MSLINNKKIRDKDKQQRKPKVLFFEEIASLIMKMEYRFRKSGFDTNVADNYKDAFKKLKEQPPTDLITVDLYMPFKRLESGVIFIEKLKNDRATKDIPLLVYSNFSDYIMGGIGNWPKKSLKMTKLGKEFYTAEETEALLNRILKAGVSKDKILDKIDIEVEKLLEMSKTLLKK